jgi:hypothetical protein
MPWGEEAAVSDFEVESDFITPPTDEEGESAQGLAERRSGVDRRARTLRIFSGYRRRRSKGRRETDRANYIDIYDAGSWGVALSVLILSIMDALLTSFQISIGKSQEANPLMHMVIVRKGIYAFVGFKAAMTALPLAIIMLHKEWKLARYAARLCLGSYILIAFYHIYLLFI